LTAILSEIDGVRVFPYEDTISDGKLSIYFTYKEGQSSTEEKAKFIDWLARRLGSSNEEAGYDTHIAMWWMGDKGIDSQNEPFFTIDILLPQTETVLNILSQSQYNIGEAFTFALGANHYGEDTARIVKIAIIPLNWIRTISAVFFVCLRVVTLAPPTRLFKSHILSLFAKFSSLWHTRIIGVGNQVCQS